MSFGPPGRAKASGAGTPKSIEHRRKYSNLIYIKNGGWHFSFLMDAKKIRSKLLSYAHTEYNNDNYNNLDKINFLIKNEKDLFGRNMEYKKVNFDQNFPDYIVENRNKFKEWII